MRTADNIRIAYKAMALMNKADGLTLTESVDMVEVRKDDPTGMLTAEWTIYVSTAARRQVARLYNPMTGEDVAINSHDAECYIMGIKDATRH